MSNLKPRNPCWITRRTNSFDGNGQPTFSTSVRKTKCAIVWLYSETDKTTVRADSSASRGRADESLATGRILLKPNEVIKTGDLVEIYVKGGDNITIEVNKVFRRPDVNNVIHHVDVEGLIWASS